MEYSIISEQIKLKVSKLLCIDSIPIVDEGTFGLHGQILCMPEASSGCSYVVAIRAWTDLK